MIINHKNTRRISHVKFYQILDGIYFAINGIITIILFYNLYFKNLEKSLASIKPFLFKSILLNNKEGFNSLFFINESRIFSHLNFKIFQKYIVS